MFDFFKKVQDFLTKRESPQDDVFALAERAMAQKDYEAVHVIVTHLVAHHFSKDTEFLAEPLFEMANFLKGDDDLSHRSLPAFLHLSMRSFVSHSLSKKAMHAFLDVVMTHKSLGKRESQYEKLLQGLEDKKELAGVAARRILNFERPFLHDDYFPHEVVNPLSSCRKALPFLILKDGADKAEALRDIRAVLAAETRRAEIKADLDSILEARIPQREEDFGLEGFDIICSLLKEVAKNKDVAALVAEEGFDFIDNQPIQKAPALLRKMMFAAYEARDSFEDRALEKMLDYTRPLKPEARVVDRRAELFDLAAHGYSTYAWKMLQAIAHDRDVLGRHGKADLMMAMVLVARPGSKRRKQITEDYTAFVCENYEPEDRLERLIKDACLANKVLMGHRDNYLQDKINNEISGAVLDVTSGWPSLRRAVVRMDVFKRLVEENDSAAWPVYVRSHVLNSMGEQAKLISKYDNGEAMLLAVSVMKKAGHVYDAFVPTVMKGLGVVRDPYYEARNLMDLDSEILGKTTRKKITAAFEAAVFKIQDFDQKIKLAQEICGGEGKDHFYESLIKGLSEEDQDIVDVCSVVAEMKAAYSGLDCMSEKDRSGKIVLPKAFSTPTRGGATKFMLRVTGKEL